MTFTEAVDILNRTFRAALVKTAEGQLVLKRSGYEDQPVDFPPLGDATLKRVHYACNAQAAKRLVA